MNWIDQTLPYSFQRLKTHDRWWKSALGFEKYENVDKNGGIKKDGWKMILIKVFMMKTHSSDDL